ncbi:EexN family lipoprotein [Enterobacter ludwigii]|uniref:EexN family lipoprotein n=1 Tax=Enterobacter ludwigii TaxID=299767 RepID=UPI003FD470FD
MKLKTLTFTVLASVIALIGCQDKTSVEWYMAHHDDMLTKYRECIFNQNFEPQDCQHARDALHREEHKPDVSEGYKKIRRDLLDSTTQAPIANLN